MAKKGAIGEKETRFFESLIGGLVRECRTVNPGEVGGFDFRNSGGGELFAEGGSEEVAVGAEVGEEVLTPRFAMLVGGFGSVVGEAVDLGESVTAGGGEAAADGVVWNDGEGVAEARDVVGFTGSEKGDGAIAESVREVESGKMGRFFFVEDEVAVDLIGKKNEVVLFAEGRELHDFLFGEDAAHRVLGIAEDEELGLRDDFGFERVPVEGPASLDFEVIDGLEFH